jgi:hypothetical protein
LASRPQALDAVGVLGPLAHQLPAVAVGLAAVLVLGRRDVDDRPEIPLAAVITHEHGRELADVDGIALGAAGAAVDLDGGGVDDHVVDPAGGEGAMEPEAVAAGLVAGADRGVVGQAESAAGAVDLAAQRCGVAGRDDDAAGGRGRRDAEGQSPGAPAQLEGQIERRRSAHGTIVVVGR